MRIMRTGIEGTYTHPHTHKCATKRLVCSLLTTNRYWERIKLEKMEKFDENILRRKMQINPSSTGYQLFGYRQTFNQDLNRCVVYLVTTLYSTFNNTEKFNCNISD